MSVSIPIILILFEAALTNAAAGDTITLAPGTYTMTRQKFSLVNKNGNAANRITVRAATWRTVTIRWVTNGATYVEGFLMQDSAYWTFENLIMESDCSADTDDGLCEHLIHITGASDYFELRTSILRNANAQIKLNSYRGSIPISQPPIFPNNGVIEWCEFYDTAARRTDQPVTKLNIDGGKNWIIRGNYIHDYEKAFGDTISFAAFYKAGASNAIFERNVVQCERDTSGGDRIGLTLGQPTSPDTACENNMCTPWCVNCWSRNNIQFNCPSTVCTFVQKAPGARVAHEASCEIQMRFTETTNAVAQNNILASIVRIRDGATLSTNANNLVSLGDNFSGKFRDPANGDFRLAVGNENDPSIIGKGATLSWVTDDFCGNPRTPPYDLGPLQYSLYTSTPSCLTNRPNHPFFGQAAYGLTLASGATTATANTASTTNAVTTSNAVTAAAAAAAAATTNVVTSTNAAAGTTNAAATTSNAVTSTRATTTNTVTTTNAAAIAATTNAGTTTNAVTATNAAAAAAATTSNAVTTTNAATVAASNSVATSNAATTTRAVSTTNAATVAATTSTVAASTTSTASTSTASTSTVAAATLLVTATASTAATSNSVTTSNAATTSASASTVATTTSATTTAASTTAASATTVAASTSASTTAQSSNTIAVSLGGTTAAVTTSNAATTTNVASTSQATTSLSASTSTVAASNSAAAAAAAASTTTTAATASVARTTSASTTTSTASVAATTIVSSTSAQATVSASTSLSSTTALASAAAVDATAASASTSVATSTALASSTLSVAAAAVAQATSAASTTTEAVSLASVTGSTSTTSLAVTTNEAALGTTIQASTTGVVATLAASVVSTATTSAASTTAAVTSSNPNPVTVNGPLPVTQTTGTNPTLVTSGGATTGPTTGSLDRIWYVIIRTARCIDWAALFDQISSALSISRSRFRLESYSGCNKRDNTLVMYLDNDPDGTLAQLVANYLTTSPAQDVNSATVSQSKPSSGKKDIFAWWVWVCIGVGALFLIALIVVAIVVWRVKRRTSGSGDYYYRALLSGDDHIGEALYSSDSAGGYHL